METVQVLKSVGITLHDECIIFLWNPINFDLSSSLPKKYRKKHKKRQNTQIWECRQMIIQIKSTPFERVTPKVSLSEKKFDGTSLVFT